jgi:phage gpG-like protein
VITVDINGGSTNRKIGEVLDKLQDGRLLFQRIAATLEAETEQSFEAQGRPHGMPLSKQTIAERTKRTAGGNVLKMLQDRGILASSISSGYDAASGVATRGCALPIRIPRFAMWNAMRGG